MAQPNSASITGIVTAAIITWVVRIVAINS